MTPLVPEGVLTPPEFLSMDIGLNSKAMAAAAFRSQTRRGKQHDTSSITESEASAALGASCGGLTRS
jgi:hypothetical protein